MSPRPDATDDTSRRETKLREERDRLVTVLEGMSDGIFTLDPAGRLRMFNSRARGMLGLSEEQLKCPVEQAVVLPALQTLARRGGSMEVSDEFDLPGKPIRRVSARATPLEPPGGTLVVLTDVTDMRRLETIRRDFVANVSHELRTPISVIQANAETLLDGALEDPHSARIFVEAMHRNAERLSRLLSDLLDLSRIEARRYPMAIAPTHLAPVISRAVDTLACQADERRMALEVDVPDRLIASADAKALEQVLTNLLDNALKYTPEGGRVAISARPRGATVHLEVRDNGPGIEPEHRTRIFERFYRVDPGRSRDMGGTGLGLAIVKHLVDSMHGTVGVAPAEPQGTTFWLNLPQKSPPAESKNTT